MIAWKRYTKRYIQYTVVFELNQAGGYTVTVPSLPGLVTEGADLDDARAMAADAIRCYSEGLEKAHEAIPLEREVGHFKIAVKV